MNSRGFAWALLIFLGVIVIMFGLLLPSYYNQVIGDAPILFWGLGIFLIMIGLLSVAKS